MSRGSCSAALAICDCCCLRSIGGGVSCDSIAMVLAKSTSECCISPDDDGGGFHEVLVDRYADEVIGTELLMYGMLPPYIWFQFPDEPICPEPSL